MQGSFHFHAPSYQWSSPQESNWGLAGAEQLIIVIEAGQALV
jgi:hypothetical protein